MEKRDLAQREQLIRQSATFKVSDITNVIAKFLSAVNGCDFVPLIYKNYDWIITKSFACVSEKDLADEFVMCADHDRNSWEAYANNQLRANEFINIYSSCEYEKEKDIENKDVVFGFLLDKFFVQYDPNKVNMNSFKGDEYVRYFIEYLFEMQLDFGRRLTSEELEEFQEGYTERYIKFYRDQNAKKRLKDQ